MSRSTDSTCFARLTFNTALCTMPSRHKSSQQCFSHILQSALANDKSKGKHTSTQTMQFWAAYAIQSTLRKPRKIIIYS